MLVTRAICHTHLDRRREAHDQVDDRQHRSLVAAVSTLRQRVFDSSVAADACPGPSTASWAERVSTSEGFAFCLETSAPGPQVWGWKIPQIKGCEGERGITLHVHDAALDCLPFSWFAGGVLLVACAVLTQLYTPFP